MKNTNQHGSSINSNINVDADSEKRGRTITKPSTGNSENSSSKDITDLGSNNSKQK